MKIFQICSYYIGSPLYKKLFESFDSHLFQHIYVPYQQKHNNLYSNRFFPYLRNGTINYKPIWNASDRILYRSKVKKAVSGINLNYLSSFDLIHAHTWFSDGAVAYEIKKVTNKPFIIAIRNTDLNYFYKYRIDVRKYGHKILLNASKIILISPSYQNLLKELIPPNVYSKIERKIEVVPNGIDAFWFNNPPNSITTKKKKDFIYVGDIRSNKNIDLLIKSFIKVSSNPEIGKLRLVGFRDTTRYEKILKDNYSSISNIEFYDRKSKEELKEFFKDSDIFIMISKKETFGLVYIEALSQGLPIIYSKGQGVDGYFEDVKIGEKVDCNNIDDISNAMLKIVKNYNEYKKNTNKESYIFNWDTISVKYLEIYKSLN